MPNQPVAAVILAHADPAQVARIIRVLSPIPVFVHCDRRTPDHVFHAMLEGAPDQVRVVNRRRTTLSSWSLVAAELDGIHKALNETHAEHIIVMSGSCYPIVPTDELISRLDTRPGQTLFETHQLPIPVWETWRNHDGGHWRFNRRFLTLNDQVVHVGGIPLRTVWQRVPPGLILHGSLGQWKIYSRSHAERLLGALNSDPALIDFFRHTFVPEESCAATILKSPAIAGALAETVSGPSPWYLEWPTARAHHPRSLSADAFESIKGARSNLGAMFVRKVSSSSPDLLARIDDELRSA